MKYGSSFVAKFKTLFAFNNFIYNNKYFEIVFCCSHGSAKLFSKGQS